MADLVINGKNYNGVSSVKIPNSSGTQETFIQPSGDKNITANGTVDVSAFARAIVNVPQSASGTMEINANGTYDVTTFAQVIVNVAGGANIPIYTGEKVVTNANTQKAIDHNLNLSSYIYIFWDKNMETFIGSGDTNQLVVCGVGAYGFDANLPSSAMENYFGFVHVKAYKPSDGSWRVDIRNMTTSTDANTPNSAFIKASINDIRKTTYKWVILDVSGLVGGASE